MRFRKSTHAVYHLQYHVVWTTRYRRPILVEGIRQYLTKVLEKLDELDGDVEVQKVNVQVDHVHMIAIIPPRLSLASVIGFFKSQTAKYLKHKFANLRLKYRSVWER